MKPACQMRFNNRFKDMSSSEPSLGQVGGFWAYTLCLEIAVPYGNDDEYVFIRHYFISH